MNRTLILIGLLIVAIGLLWPWLSRLPLGQLPGDIVIRRENVSLMKTVTTWIRSKNSSTQWTWSLAPSTSM